MLRRSVRACCATAVAKEQPLMYRTLWGVPHAFGLEGDEIDGMLKRVTHHGADKVFGGIEFCAGTFFPFIGEEQRLAAALVQQRLRCIVQVHTCGYPVPPAYGLSHVHSAGDVSGHRRLQPVWREHADSLRFHAEDMAVRLRVPEGLEEEANAHPEVQHGTTQGGGSKHPLIAAINVHSGKDSLPREDTIKFLEEAVIIQRDTGIPICHETHRQRIFHNPFVLRDLRADLPTGLKLNCDLSHFVVACERVMCHENDAEFWPELLKDVIAPRAYMMHCRVGLPQSPQLQDPRAYHAKYKADYGVEGYEPAVDVANAAIDHDLYNATEAHIMWWRTIARSMRERNILVRAVPEYGPAPYQTVGDAKHLDDVVVDAGKFLRRTLL